MTSTAVSQTKSGEGPAIAEIAPMGSRVQVHLRDGRLLLVRREHFKRLANATEAQLMNYELTIDGKGAHWPDLDEDISVHGFLRYADDVHVMNNEE